MVTREVEIECLPTEIPDEFKVDVTELMIGKQLRVSDLPLDPDKMKLVTDPQRVIAHVVALRAEEEEKPAEAAVEAEAAPAEPEVIKKGKKEVEEGEAVEAEGEAKGKSKEKEKEK
jgi:large subunit ribosomal protein L25